MDQFLLQAAAGEAAGRLVEQEALRVSHLGRQRYLIRFATPSRDALLIAVRPDLPRFHLSATRARDEPPDPFAAFLDREIGGAVLSSLRTAAHDRVVDLRFRLPRRDDGALERRLVVELLGRSANMLLLDAAGSILAFCRPLESAFRAPVVGAMYRPPPGREAYADLPPGPEALPILRERFPDPASFLAPLSPVLARDLGPECPWSAESERRLVEILAAAASESWAPVVYATKPLADWTEGDSIGRDDILVSALPFGYAPGPVPASGGRVAVPFASPSAAAEAALGLIERLRDFQALKAHYETLVRKEIGRLEELVRRLEQDLVQARRSEDHRRLGEALLAGLSSARAEGGIARVLDPYDPGGAMLEVLIDPARSLQENAQALFDRYKKGKRGAVLVETRIEAARRRLDQWRALAGPAGGARGQGDLDGLREEMARLGLVHAPRPKPGRAPARERNDKARVRRLTTRDGFVVLVGKSGEENDALTFRVAAPWDFWLHAADHPGAHVVVRNPQRLKSLPEATLRTAAEIAAFYSGARQEGKVEVHYTQRKHVHKRKGMPGGQVLLRRFRTLQVTPRLPGSTLQDV